MKFSYCFSDRITPIGLPVQTRVSPFNSHVSLSVFTLYHFNPSHWEESIASDTSRLCASRPNSKSDCAANECATKIAEVSIRILTIIYSTFVTPGIATGGDWYCKSQL